MTQEFLQDAIVKDLEGLFQHKKLKNSMGTEQTVRIYAQDAPIRSGDDETTDPADLPEPYVVVRLQGGELPEQDTSQKVEAILTICVCDQAPDRQGYRDALHIVNAILHHYGGNGVVANRYVVKYPIRWVTQEDDTHPYYFAGMALAFEAPAIFKEVPEV